MIIFQKKYCVKISLFFMSLFFLVAVAFPLQKANAAADSCVCYAGSTQLASFSTTYQTVCAARCSTFSNVTAITYGDSLTKIATKPDAGNGSECLCSADNVNIVGAVASGAASVTAATMTGGMLNYSVTDWVDKNLNHPAVSVGKFATSAACEQTCANKGYKSFVLGVDFLKDVSFAKISQSDATANNTTASTPMDSSIPGTTEAGGIIQCGRGGQQMCTICDLIKGMNTIIKYIMGISIVLALASFTLAGSSYVTSFGGTAEMEAAKTIMKNAAIGMAVILTAWILVSVILFFVGAKTNLGISNVTAWGDFECSATN